MKRLLFLATLLVTAVGTWPFYPKAAEPTGYLMVISRFAGTGFGCKSTISTVSPNGQIEATEVDAKAGSLNKLSTSYDQLHQSELKKLNELRQAGWRVVNSTQVSVGNGAINETTFLLEKN
jgi:hypothetical protein